MFALNFASVCYGLKSFLSNFFDPYKAERGKGGRGGGEPDFSRRENVPLFGLRSKTKFVSRQMSHGFSPPDNKKRKIQAKSRDSEYFKLYFSIYNIFVLAGRRKHCGVAPPPTSLRKVCACGASKTLRCRADPYKLVESPCLRGGKNK